MYLSPLHPSLINRHCFNIPVIPFSLYCNWMLIKKLVTSVDYNNIHACNWQRHAIKLRIHRLENFLSPANGPSYDYARTEVKVVLSCASSNSYACFLLSKPRWWTRKYESIVNFLVLFFSRETTKFRDWGLKILDDCFFFYLFRSETS